MTRRLSWGGWLAVAALLAACQPAQNGAEDAAAAALRAAGYAKAPEVTKVVQEGPSAFVISGQATQKGRVQIVYSGQNSAGQTVTSTIGGPVDSKGQFKELVPSGPHGGLYDLLTDDSGRLIHAEGKLFVPLGHADKAAMLRAGGGSRSVSRAKSVISVVDYDGGGGLAVTGQSVPGAMVSLIVDNTVIGQAHSEADGQYYVTGQIFVPGDTVVAVEVEVSDGKDSLTRTVPVSRPQAGNRITPLAQGWRIDWALPGGGNQTTIVY